MISLLTVSKVQAVNLELQFSTTSLLDTISRSKCFLQIKKRLKIQERTSLIQLLSVISTQVTSVKLFFVTKMVSATREMQSAEIDVSKS